VGWKGLEVEWSTYYFLEVDQWKGLVAEGVDGLEVRVVHLQLPGGEGGWKGLGMERLEV